MSRSFQIVEDKIEEAEFFLSKLRLDDIDIPQFNLKESSFNLSAFLSAARSITFCLQASLNDIEGFKEWYEAQQAILAANALARFFLEARNLSQKVGYYPLRGGRVHRDASGARRVELYFAPLEDNGLAPEADVVTACEAHFRNLLEVAVDCYKTFGSIIDPEQYYTVESMKKLGFTVEDLEVNLGFPPGWTEVTGLSIKDRIALLRDHAPKVSVDWIFNKYLGTNRYGIPEELGDA
ncbi:MAG: hypothetical protein E4G99_12445 [Anaerolineales bacterium]|nr:MAG: hypothetical protein E4G99_12445 [Anaerolineales bacterium]